METISIFVDVQNIYYTTREVYSCNFDYNKFWRKVTARKKLLVANAYTTYRADKKQSEFQNILRAIGFNVKLKPFITRSDGSSKGDWDVGITIDIMESAQKSDTIILASGDGDFDLLLKKIRERFNTKSEVYGVPRLTANSLIREATVYNPIEEDLLLRQQNLK